MTKNNTRMKTKICAGAIALVMGASLGVIGTAKLKNTNEIYAYQSAVSVSNGNFSSTASGTPAIPSNWTGVENYANTTCGIVNLASTDNDVIQNDYNLQSLPTPKDSTETTKNVLMINADKGPYYAGYKTGSSISFDKQSFYRISVEAYTFAGTQTNGSMRLTGNEKIEKNEASVLKINGTNGSWRTYSIFLATGQFDSLSLDINLLLGQNQMTSEGAIFFDNVSVVKFDKAAFYQQNPATATNATFVDLSQDGLITSVLTNGDFEAGENGWSKCDDIMAGKTKAGIFTVGNGYTLSNVENPYPNSTQTSHALLINNFDNAYYGYKSDDFVVPQYAIYKLSFWAKTDSNAKATAKLVEQNPYNDDDYEAQTFTINDISTSGYSNDYTNGWKEYSFFIKGSPFVDTTMNLEFWLGEKGAEKNGYVWIDNITITKITSAQYSDNVSNGKEANLYKATSSLKIENGNFNLFSVDDINQNYPYGVENWSAENKNDTAKVGIINTARTTDNQAYLGFDLPLVDNTQNNNVLMLSNLTAQKQTVTSSANDLSADGYCKIEVYAYAKTSGKASISLVADDNILAEQNNITASEWTKYTFLVHGNFEKKSIKVQLGLGKDVACSGYAFFDRVYLTTYESKDNFDAEVEKANSNTMIVDLSKIDFKNVGQQIDGNIYESNDFKGALVDGESATIVAGVDTSNNTLVISSVNDEICFAFTNNSELSLTSSEYYQFDVKIKTTGIVQDEKKTKGASIALSGIGASFNKIDTEGEEKTYTFYVKCTEDQKVSIVISLGAVNALTQGTVAVSEISYKTITNDEYKNNIKVLEKDDAPDNVMAVGNTDSEKEDDKSEDNKTSSGVDFNLLYASTIITGLAIIIAVVCTVIRQYRRKHKKKVNVKRDYARNKEKSAKDVHKDDIKSLNRQIAKLNQKQTELAEEINTLNAENAEENKEKVDELTVEYNENKEKIENLNQQKKEKNAKYRKKVADMKQAEKAEKKMTKKR